MVANALKLGIIPPNWSELVWVRNSEPWRYGVGQPRHAVKMNSVTVQVFINLPDYR